MKLGEHRSLVIAALIVGVLAPYTKAEGGADPLVSAFARAERSHSRLKTPQELLKEANDQDALAKLPPPTEKEWCEAGGNDLYVTSPKTGNHYCISKKKSGAQDREVPKTKWDIDREIETLDYWASQPQKPASEKEECEGLFKDQGIFVISPKTGNHYCLAYRKSGAGDREVPKTKWDIEREVEALDYFSQNPPPQRSPKEECELFGDKAYVISSEGNGYCLSKRTDND